MQYEKYLIAAGLSLASLTARGQEQLAAVAPRPPMGWNSYDCYGATVTAAEVKANADYQAKYLKSFGWEYVVVDFCWYYPEPAGSRVSPPQQRKTAAGYEPALAMDGCSRWSGSFQAPRKGRDSGRWQVMCIPSG